jgi:amidase
VEAFGFQVGLFIAAHEPAGNDFASLSAVLDQERRRLAFRATWDRHFNDVDVMLLPTTVTAAIAHDARRFDERTIVTSAGDVPYTDQTYWISHAALPGLPALSAPVGQTSEGLPVGVQVIGPALEDDTAITFAALLADITPGYRPPPLPQAHR